MQDYATSGYTHGISYPSLAMMNGYPSIQITIQTFNGPYTLRVANELALREQLQSLLLSRQIDNQTVVRTIDEFYRLTSHSPQSIQIQVPPNKYGYESLSVNQKWIENKYKTNKRLLIGLQVIIIANALGNAMSSHLKGIIVKIAENKTKKKLIYSILRDDNEDIEKCLLYQIEAVDDLFKLDPSNKNILVNDFVECMVKKISSQYKDLDKKIATEDKYLEEYFRRIKETKNKIVNLKIQKKKAEGGIFTKEELLKILTALRKHRQIEDAYVSTERSIVIITKMLYATNEKTHTEDRRKEIGSFYIRLNFKEFNHHISIKNLTFERFKDGGDGPYDHPHIEGDSICWGNNSQEVEVMWKDGQIYELIDFIIVFLSVYPQTDGKPYVTYDDWMDNKKKNKNHVDLPTKLI